jgi:hypothetical protein
MKPPHLDIEPALYLIAQAPRRLGGPGIEIDVGVVAANL